jgi:hypothetical protein
MAGTYPNLDAADLELRVRTYLNETTAGFFTQADIWRWLSVAVKDIAQSTLCVRRVLDALTTNGTRTVTTNCYKVFHVEYVPSSGRPLMLTKISPLQVGHYPLTGTTPQYWYEFGSTIGIDPCPDATYKLNLYVADIPKMSVLSFASFTEGAGATNWTDSATGWTLGATMAHAGTGPDTITYNTALTASTTYTYTFTVSGVGTGGTVTPYAGSTAGVAVTLNGYHTQNLTSSATTPGLIFSAANTIVIDDLFVYKEADYAAVGDQTELPCMWQHLLALYATYSGLIKNRRYEPAQMLESIYQNEIAYLRQNVIEVIPDGKTDLSYNR